MLGHPWVAVDRNHEYPDTAILTRHVVVPNTNLSTSGGVGAKIMLRTGYMIHFWSLHLDYTSYGPYAANNKLVNKLDQIMAGENVGGSRRKRKEFQCNKENKVQVVDHKSMKFWIFR